MKGLASPSLTRLPLPKPPLFTTDFFSTKSFGPGHLVGTAVLVGGLFGLVKYIIARSDATRASDPAGAQAGNARGHYGK